MVAPTKFLADRLPALLDEWHAHRDRLRAAGRLPTPGE
jgi:hypothetical protein